MSDAKNKSQDQQAKGSGSDTVSAAKISAGTSVGNIGESPMPHAMGNEQSRHQDQSAHQSTQRGQSAGDSRKQAAGGMQQKASDAAHSAREWARDTYEEASEWASEGPRRMGGVQRFVMENPVMVGVAGLAAGLLLGALLPRTRRESEVFGEWADEVREQGLRYAHQLAQQGREMVEEALNNAPSAIGQDGGQAGQDRQAGMGPH